MVNAGDAFGHSHGFGVLCDETVDVANALLIEDLIYGDEDASLFDVAETVVDGRSEHSHRGRETHVGVDQRRDIVATGSHLVVEDSVVGLEIVLREERGQLLAVGLDLQRVHGQYEAVVVGGVAL